MEAVANEPKRHNPDCVHLIAELRAVCLKRGATPGELGDMLLEEALLAWMMHGLSEHDIHQRIARVIRQDLRQWFYRARIATGQCDCVREVHFEAKAELEVLTSSAKGGSEAC